MRLTRNSFGATKVDPSKLDPTQKYNITMGYKLCLGEHYWEELERFHLFDLGPFPLISWYFCKEY